MAAGSSDDDGSPALVVAEAEAASAESDATAAEAEAPEAEAPEAEQPEEPQPVRRLEHVAGLENLGNTCFFNSVLQNLCGLDALAAHFSSSPLDEAAPLTAGLRQLLRAYAAAAPGATVKPSQLHGAIVKRAPRFKGYGQQDAQELLMTLLDGLQWEEVVAARAAAAAKAACAAAPPAPSSDGDDGATSNGDAAGAAAPPAPPPPPLQVRTFVDDFFGGMLASTIVCGTCHTASTTTEPFMDVSLPIPAPATPPAAAAQFNSRFAKVSAFAGGPASPKRQPGKLASLMADAAEARAASSKKEKNAKIAAAGAAAGAAVARARMSGKERKKAEKAARREAKRVRKPRAPKDKARDADGEAGPAAPDSPRSVASSTTSGSDGGDDDDEDELSDASSPAPPPGAAQAADADSDEGEPQPAPDVITLGPPEAPGGAWGLEMVDDAPAAAEEAARLKREAAEAADGETLETTGSLPPLSALPPLSTLPPLRLPPPSETMPIPIPIIIAPPPPEATAAPAAAAASGPPSVLSCLAAFVADEQLTGACRYACEACARAAAASAAARRAKSVRWAPGETLESIRLIPPRPPDDGYPPMPNSDEEDDGGDEADALGLPLPGASDEDEAGAAPQMRDLTAQFAEVATDDGSTDATLAAAAAKLGPLTLGGGSDDTEVDEVPPAPDRAPSPPPAEAQEVPELEPATSSPPPEADDAAAATTPAPVPPAPVLRDAVKRLRFAQLPRCLVVHLKRFRQDARGRTSKISGHVVFDESLDLAPFWSPPPPAEGGAQAAPAAPAPASRYRLQGVVEHSGGLHGGHYVAFVRRGADWHYASDRHVRPATLAQALSAEAYLLFYARDDDDDAAAAAQP